MLSFAHSFRAGNGVEQLNASHATLAGFAGTGPRNRQTTRKEHCNSSTQTPSTRQQATLAKAYVTECTVAPRWLFCLPCCTTTRRYGRRDSAPNLLKASRLLPLLITRSEKQKVMDEKEWGFLARGVLKDIQNNLRLYR
ncbi:hypothetical protein TRVL_10152 [Trypanosoma vivax]|nr:hypothetical protein TRVL_10152 [Trypanosoma vivax]